MLEEGVVRVTDKVIKSPEFASEVQGVREACKALGVEKGMQLGGCSTISSELEVPNPGHVARRAEEVDTALSSLVETDFVGLFRLGKLDYDSFHLFIAGRVQEVLRQTPSDDLCLSLFVCFVM
ncbi:unnamed protein product [Lactuca saligna]|uniref:Uncharacterized protein n=1 Tax=Lactuca saligna TaxID=75948 RepID=A0AA35Z8G7_LACSI|nr:unnamed protein product [Lactuca saligna]